jgi:glycosyltransferase involved in cell wall biosynthesis
MDCLVAELRHRGVRVTRNRHVPARVALIPIAMPPALLRRWKKSGRKVIQRLDGVFYDPESARYCEARNADLREVFSTLADAYIYQSHYSRRQCDHYLGSAREGLELAVIPNGTDLTRFFPAESRQIPAEGVELRVVTAGNFRDPEMLLPVLEALDFLALERPLVLDVAGPVASAGWLGQRSYVRAHGALDGAALAAIFRASDVFIFSFLNPNCPNVVAEASACGLPVVAFDSGAMRELCGFNVELLAPVGPELIHRREQLHAGPLLDALRTYLARPEFFRNRVLAAREQFAIEVAAARYLEVFKAYL